MVLKHKLWLMPYISPSQYGRTTTGNQPTSEIHGHTNGWNRDDASTWQQDTQSPTTLSEMANYEQWSQAWWTTLAAQSCNRQWCWPHYRSAPSCRLSWLVLVLSCWRLLLSYLYFLFIPSLSAYIKNKNTRRGNKSNNTKTINLIIAFDVYCKARTQKLCQIINSSNVWA